MTNLASRSAFRVFLAITAVLLLGNALGCANGEFRFGDPFDRKLTLSEAQHRYTVLIRWSEFQKARSFVAEEDREAFIDRMEALDDARFTDYESDAVELDDEKENATIRVKYTVYTPSVPYELEVEETQEWSREGLGNNWQVYSTFEGLQQFARN